MFVQTSSNIQKRSKSTSDVTNNRNYQLSDKLMFDFEDISKFCGGKTTEVQELALDVVSKMVESWLDPNNLIQDLPCSCADDVLDYIGKFSDNQSGNSAGSHLDEHNLNQKPSEKRSNRVHHGNPSSFDNATGNSNEKRPRCNTGDKTASRSPNEPGDVVCNSPQAGRKVPDEYFDLVALHLPIILRLCFACPFGKVREKCRGILEGVREKGLPVPCSLVFGPSGFVPFSEKLNTQTRNTIKTVEAKERFKTDKWLIKVNTSNEYTDKISGKKQSKNSATESALDIYDQRNISENSDSDSDVEVSLLQPASKNAKKSEGSVTRKYRFQQGWLEQKDFANWLVRASDINRPGKKADAVEYAACKLCHITIFPNIRDIMKHLKSQKHKCCSKQIDTNRSIKTMIQKSTSVEVRYAELRLTAMLASNNLPFILMDTLTKVCADVFPDSIIAKSVSVPEQKPLL